MHVTAPQQSPDSSAVYCEGKQWRKFLVKRYEVRLKEGRKVGAGQQEESIHSWFHQITVKLKSTVRDSEFCWPKYELPNTNFGPTVRGTKAEEDKCFSVLADWIEIFFNGCWHSTVML